MYPSFVNRTIPKILQWSRSLCTALVIGVAVSPVAASAQWSTTFDQFYLPGSSDWQFRHNYPAADRLFNAFDYGHAILYERLWNDPKAPVSALEEKEYNFITRELLVHPPNLPLEEGAIEIAYAKLAPEAKQMFDWAHLLHRQIYDAWADERLTVAEKDARVQELVRYYKTRKDLAFSSLPKSMALMEGQPYSLAFRNKYPKFNGLIWAYHWLQIGLYEPLLAGRNKDERQTGVLATVTRFRQMLESPPSQMPRMMPMTPAVAPLFTARYPEAAIIFDNLHSMHDVVSDILANPSVSKAQKREAILLAARRYRDNTSFVMTPPEWKTMAVGMGIENMGGPVRGFLASFPQPTVERGAMAGHAGMPGMSGMTGMSGMSSGAAKTATGASAPSGGMAGMDHSSMPGMAGSTAPAKQSAASAQSMQGMDHSTMAGMNMGTGSADHSADMVKLHTQLMADPVIRTRVNSTPALRDLMTRVTADMATVPSTATRKSPSTATRRPTSSAARRTSTTKTTAKKTTTAAKRTTTAKPKTATKTAAKPPAKPAPKADPMAGMDHSKMNMGPKK